MKGPWALAEQRLRLLKAGDFDQVASMLADELVYVHSSGIRHGREAYLAFVRSRIRLLEASLSEVTVVEFGPCACLTGRLKQIIVRSGEQEPVAVDSWISEVWVLRSCWQLLSFQSTRVATV